MVLKSKSSGTYLVLDFQHLSWISLERAGIRQSWEGWRDRPVRYWNWGETMFENWAVTIFGPIYIFEGSSYVFPMKFFTEEILPNEIRQWRISFWWEPSLVFSTNFKSIKTVSFAKSEREVEKEMKHVFTHKISSAHIIKSRWAHKKQKLSTLKGFVQLICSNAC